MKGSGYRLVIGFMAIIIISFLWIALNEVIVDVGAAFNNLTTDSDTISRNNMVISIFYWSLFFIIICVAIWILKSSLEGKEEQQVIVYGQ